jgi:hypothetical protein
MNDLMRTEQLQPGQGPMGLPEGGPGQSLPAHIEAGRLRGSAAWLAGRDAEGQAGGGLTELGPETGGGGDAIDDFVFQRGGYDKLLQQIQQNGWTDAMVWTLNKDTPQELKFTVAEIKQRAAAAAAPPPPEARPATPRPVDWRDSLPPTLKDELSQAERRWDLLEIPILQLIKNQMQEALSSWGIDGKWPSEGGLQSIRPEDVKHYLMALDEVIKVKDQRVLIELTAERIDKMGLREHIENIKSRLHLSSDSEVILALQAAERKAKMLLRNPPYELFPLDLRNFLIALIRNRGNGGS